MHASQVQLETVLVVEAHIEPARSRPFHAHWNGVRIFVEEHWAPIDRHGHYLLKIVDPASHAIKKAAIKCRVHANKPSAHQVNQKGWMCVAHVHQWVRQPCTSFHAVVEVWIVSSHKVDRVTAQLHFVPHEPVELQLINKAEQMVCYAGSRIFFSGREHAHCAQLAGKRFFRSCDHAVIDAIEERVYEELPSLVGYPCSRDSVAVRTNYTFSGSEKGCACLNILIERVDLLTEGARTRTETCAVRVGYSNVDWLNSDDQLSRNVSLSLIFFKPVGINLV